VPLTIEVELEDDGRWLAEVAELPGVLAYGRTREEAVGRVQALSLRVLADRLKEKGDATGRESFLIMSRVRRVPFFSQRSYDSRGLREAVEGA
jgi:predicted RNase H-like HicB family nuclease